MNAHNRAGNAARALNDALDAWSASQDEVGRLLEEILHKAEEKHRWHAVKRSAEMRALEHAIEEALAQAAQEDQEIERILRALIRAFGQVDDRPALRAVASPT